jgi:hypothetical protein
MLHKPSRQQDQSILPYLVGNGGSSQEKATKCARVILWIQAKLTGLQEMEAEFRGMDEGETSAEVRGYRLALEEVQEQLREALEIPKGL